MYESLLLLPYFQGMSKNDLTSILDKVKLEFTRYSDGEKILSEGEQCNNFIITLNNKIKSETTAPNGTFRLLEIHESPYVIEPYSLFGTSTKYNKNYYATGECNLLSINKSYFFSEFTKTQHIYNKFTKSHKSKSTKSQQPNMERDSTKHKRTYSTLYRPKERNTMWRKNTNY